MSNGNGHLHHDAWLAGILGRAVFRLDLENGSAAATEDFGLAGLPEKGPLFVYTKVPAAAVDRIESLERRGFHLVDTQLTFEKRIEQPKALPRGAVRFSRPADEEAVTETARRSFAFSRFHLDRHIPGETADEIKARWVNNFFRGGRGDALVVAEAGGRVAGFLLLIANGKERSLTIDLVAVDRPCRGSGLATAMIGYAEQHLAEYETLRAGTQLANEPSTKLYEAQGFKLKTAAHVFHLHRP